MSGQFGFVATDPVPPSNGVIWDAEEIEEYGLPLLMTVWERVCDKPAGERLIVLERIERFPYPEDWRDL